MISLGRSHQGSFSILSKYINSCLVLLKKQFANLSASINCSSMKRSSFVIDSEWLIDDTRFVLKDPLNVLKFFSDKKTFTQLITFGIHSIYQYIDSFCNYLQKGLYTIPKPIHLFNLWIETADSSFPLCQAYNIKNKFMVWYFNCIHATGGMELI